MALHVIVFESAADGEPSLAEVVAAAGCEVCVAPTTEALADAVGSGRHQAVIFALSPGRPDDLVALRLLRRLAPELPLIIAATDASLEVRRLIQTLRPIYFAAWPVDGEELCEAVRAACEPPKRAAIARTDDGQAASHPGRHHGHQPA